MITGLQFDTNADDCLDIVGSICSFTVECTYPPSTFSVFRESCTACTSHGRIILWFSVFVLVWLVPDPLPPGRGSDWQILKSAYRRILDTALPQSPSSPCHRLPGLCLLWTMACFQFIDYPPLMGANIPTPRICQQIRYFPPAIDL